MNAWNRRGFILTCVVFSRGLMQVAGTPAVHAALTCKAEWPSDVPFTLSPCPSPQGSSFRVFPVSPLIFYLLLEIILRFPFVVYRCAVICFGN